MLASLLFVVAQQNSEQHPAMEAIEAELKSIYSSNYKKRSNPNEIFSKFTINLGKVRTPEGLFWNPPTATILTARTWAAFNGAQDGREYNDQAGFLNGLSESIPPAGRPTRKLMLVADLWAWPGISDWDESVNRLANADDVRKVKFVLLTDDKDPRPIKPDIVTKTGEVVETDSYITPELTATGVSNTDVTLPNGGKVTASTVTYSTRRKDNVTAYNATYSLVFTIVDKEGNPLIKKGHKKLTLKVIRPNGEWTTRWMLDTLSKFK